MSAPVTIVLVNQSTVLSDAEVAAVVPALQAAHHEDFRAWWDTTASFVAGANVAPTAHVWPAYILDTSDQAGALGYHSLDKNTPYLRVFAKTDQEYNRSWTVTLTHEVWEALADPWLSTAEGPHQGAWYAREVGDPVEDDRYSYLRDGVQISNFVTPAWYTGRGTQYDHGRYCGAARDVLSGGYQSVWANGAWSSLGGARDADDPRVRARPA